MCEGATPAGVSDALLMLERALGYLAGADAASLTCGEQAQSLLALEQAEARHTAARARMLSAFIAQDGYQEDAQGSARTWLRWRTGITRGAAAGAVGWARRLAGHPVIADALAAGELSASWAREICGWTDRLPEDKREAADAILVAAARGGAELADLAALAEEMYERSRPDQPDPSDGAVGDRALWLGVTTGGAGRLEGDLTPGCAAALSAVLESLGRTAGPEDTRTAAERRHDALEEACRRLIASGMLPARAGQPTQAQVHLTLSQLRDLPGAAAAEAVWLTARARQHGWLSGPDADAAACDATLAPVVSAAIDPSALDRLMRLVLHGPASTGPGSPGPGSPGPGSTGPERCVPDSPDSDSLGAGSSSPGSTGADSPGPGSTGPERCVPDSPGPDSLGAGSSSPGSTGADSPGSGSTGSGSTGSGSTGPGSTGPASTGPASTGRDRHGPDSPGLEGNGPEGNGPQGRSPGRRGPIGGGTSRGVLGPAALARLRRHLLALAADVMSGPGGLAAWLRQTQLDGALAAGSMPLGVPLPLDTTGAQATIPAHLRRAVTVRHPCCAFAGCQAPASECQVHHLVPRSQGGPTTLANLVPLCTFHHLIAVHRWGWTLVLNPDGTTTATSPDGARILHSRPPPAQAA